VNWESDAYKIGLAKYAASLFPRQTPVLDFGCGIGTVLQDFAEAGFTSLDGIDINELNRRFTIKRFESMKGVSCSVFGETSSVHGNYGIIISLHVLEHLEDPARTMEDLSSRLTVNGLFFGVAPFNLTGGNFPEHRIENKNLRLEKLAENAGLRVLNKVPFGSFDGEPFELVVAQKNR
jgi:2-polyprenyl-3-methyl-5-hydroxy-6-metoxy-1,4-benzoquinol methylase